MHKQPKDLARASRLPILPRDDHQVADDLKKVRSGRRLAPVLLVRGAADQGLALTVADGYHRVCASAYVDDEVDIPCRLVDL